MSELRTLTQIRASDAWAIGRLDGHARAERDLSADRPRPRMTLSRRPS